MYSIKNQSNEVCRMPWFLVEANAHGGSSEKYFVVHSVDIIENCSSNMYVNGIVKFDHNQSTIEGNVLLASEDRSFVEQEMKRLTTNTAEFNKRKVRLFFVQYSNTSMDLVHAVITEKALLQSVGLQQNSGEVYIKDAQNQYRATVLLSNDDEKQMQHEFEKLKSWCLQKCLNVTYPTHTLNSIVSAGNWMLLQYCKAPLEVVYAVLNERDTHWTEQNLYKDVVAYIDVGGTIFQALILEKSRDLQSLLMKMNSFKECAALSTLLQMERMPNVNAIRASMPSAFQPYSDKVMLT